MIKLLILFACIFILTGCSNNDSKNSPSNTSPDNQISNDSAVRLSKKNETQSTEESLSSFSTKIYTPDDENRQTNLKLCCSTLNETIVKSGQTFSFCDTIGEATPESGYKKADIINPDGSKSKGYGGRKMSS